MAAIERPGAGARRRGRPPVTNRDEIVAAALRLARQDGLDAVTIKGLARHMGVSPNTFYNHGTTKDDILAMMVEVAMGTVSPDLDPAATWDDQLRRTMMSFYDTLIEHHVIIEMLVDQRPAIGTALFAARDAALDAIDGIPLSRVRAYELFNLLGAVVVGVAMVEGSRVARADRFGNARLRGMDDRVQHARIRVEQLLRAVIADAVLSAAEA